MAATIRCAPQNAVAQPRPYSGLVHSTASPMGITPVASGCSVDDVLSPAIDQPGHDVHRLGDRLGSAVEPRRGRHELAGTGVEHLADRSACVRSSVSPVGVARVTENVRLSPTNTPYLRYPRSPPIGPVRGGYAGTVEQPVEAAEVDDPGVVGLRRRSGRNRSRTQPLGQGAAPTGGHDDQIAVRPAAIGEPHAGDVWRAGARRRPSSPTTATPVRNSTRPSASAARRSTHSNVVRRQASIASSSSSGCALEVRHRRRQVDAERHLRGALVEELLVDVGVVGLQQARPSGRGTRGCGEPAGAPRRSQSKASSADCGIGVSSRSNTVTRVTTPGQGDCRAQAGDPSSDDRHVHDSRGLTASEARASGCRISTRRSRVLALSRTSSANDINPSSWRHKQWRK